MADRAHAQGGFPGVPQPVRLVLPPERRDGHALACHAQLRLVRGGAQGLVRRPEPGGGGGPGLRLLGRQDPACPGGRRGDRRQEGRGRGGGGGRGRRLRGRGGPACPGGGRGVGGREGGGRGRGRRGGGKGLGD